MIVTPLPHGNQGQSQLVEESGQVERREDVLDSYPTRLSSRELEVLGHLQEGLTNRQIADRLYISTNTINKHVQQVLRKMHVRNRVQAAMHAGSLAG